VFFFFVFFAIVQYRLNLIRSVSPVFDAQERRDFGAHVQILARMLWANLAEHIIALQPAGNVFN
jgi:hypothetical protein